MLQRIGASSAGWHWRLPAWCFGRAPAWRCGSSHNGSGDKLEVAGVRLVCALSRQSQMSGDDILKNAPSSVSAVELRTQPVGCFSEHGGPPSWKS